MPVPAQISDLTNDPNTNSPQGTESAKGVVDDYLRAHGAFIKQLSDELKGSTVTLPSAATVAIGFAKSANIAITGTATISGFDVIAEGTLRYVQFKGAMRLTHNPAVLVLPGSVDIVTVSGDCGVFKSAGLGKWDCILYQYKAGHLPRSGGTILGALAVTGSMVVNGNLGVDAQLLLASGSASAPALTFSSEGGADTGFYRGGDGIISVACNGVVVARFTPTGIEAIKVTQTT